MLAHLRGEGPRPARRALAVLQAPPLNCVIEAVVDLDAAPAPRVLSWKQVRAPRSCQFASTVAHVPPPQCDCLLQARMIPSHHCQPLLAHLPDCPPACLQMEGVQPALTVDDVLESELALKANKQFRALMEERFGITDMDSLAVDPWCAPGTCVHPAASALGRDLQLSCWMGWLAVCLWQ